MNDNFEKIGCAILIIIICFLFVWMGNRIWTCVNREKQLCVYEIYQEGRIIDYKCMDCRIRNCSDDSIYIKKTNEKCGIGTAKMITEW